MRLSSLKVVLTAVLLMICGCSVAPNAGEPDRTAAVRKQIQSSIAVEVPEAQADFILGMTFVQPDTIELSMQPRLDRTRSYNLKELHGKIYRSVFSGSAAVPSLVQGKYALRIVTMGNGGETLTTKARSLEEWESQNK